MGTARRRPTDLATAAGAAATTVRDAVAGAAANLRRSSAPGARSYEATFGAAGRGLYAAMAADLCRTLADAVPGHVVDIGAGPGGLVAALAPRLPASRFTLVDVDPAMVALARRRMAREGLAHRVDVLVGDVTALPLREQSVDLVTSSFSVHHWPDAASGFAQVHRILRPGGHAVIYDLPDWWGRFETQAPALLRAALDGGLADAHASRLAWPWSVRLVQRLEAVR